MTGAGVGRLLDSFGGRTLRIPLILPAVRTDILSKSTLTRQRHACVWGRRIDDSITYV